MRIDKINGNKAVVDSGGHNHEVNIDLLKNVKIGDYILVHGDMAINKVAEEDAKKIAEYVKNASKK